MTSTHVLIILLTPGIRKSNKRLIVRGDLFIFWGLKKKCRNNTKCIYEKWNFLHLHKLKYTLFYGGQYYTRLYFQSLNNLYKIFYKATLSHNYLVRDYHVYNSKLFLSMIVWYLLVKKKQKLYFINETKSVYTFPVVAISIWPNLIVYIQILTFVLKEFWNIKKINLKISFSTRSQYHRHWK